MLLARPSSSRIAVRDTDRNTRARHPSQDALRQLRRHHRRQISSALFIRACNKISHDKPFRPFVITSPEIWALWSKPFLASFPKLKRTRQPSSFFPPASATSASPASNLSPNSSPRAGADRDALLLAFGGGVIGDITGFLAAIYMRGIRYVQIPTTFLAQVDSSIGGKTGVNLAAGKNLIGSFHHPQAVFADTDLLGTLPPAELRAGLQESIKAGIIYDAKLFRYMEQNAEAILTRRSRQRPDPRRRRQSSASKPTSSARTKKNPACA